MRCDEAQQKISDCLDDGQALGPDVCQHVRGCMACAAFERDCRELDSLLVAGRAAAPAAGPRRRMRKVLIIAAMAAAAVFVLSLLPFGKSKPRPNPRPGIEPQQLQPFAPSLAGPIGEVVEKVAVAPIREEVTSLVADARSATRSILSCLPSPSWGTSTQAVQ